MTTAWTVSVTDTFLNELLSLPQKVSKKVTKTVKLLEKDPISADGDAKKIKGYQNNVYRVRLGDYRLFYSFGQGWVKLLSIRKRDERTYQTEIPEFTTPTPPPDHLPSEDVVIPSQETEPEADTTSTLPYQLTPQLLSQWQIPQQYWDSLLNVTHAEALLELSLPDKLLGRILDNLYPRAIAEIDQQPDYLLPEITDLDRFFEGNLSAFLLKLDSEQEKLRDFGKNGPILVKGGAGTGKSTLALYRVEKLLRLGYSSILFTTYTNALVEYSQQLLQQLLGQPPAQLGITVTTVDSLAYQYYTQHHRKPRFLQEEKALSTLKTALKTASLPAKNAFDKQVRLQTLQKLGLNYLYSEITEVIQAQGITTLEDYLNLSRRGRNIPLKAKIRESLWTIYERWCELINAENYLTWEQLRQHALHLAQQTTPKPYNALVVDEAQDLSPVALRFLLALVPDFQGVYLTADASQSIYQQGFSWKKIHSDLQVAGRTLLLKRNYRNTEQISQACDRILLNTDAGDEECLQPTPSPHQGDPPVISYQDDPNVELESIRDFFLKAAKRHRLPLHGGAVLCPHTSTARTYAKELQELGLNAKFVSGKQIDLKAPHVKVLTLHSAKGLEFPFVVVVLTASPFPEIDPELPTDEHSEVIKAQRRLLYVGCSRAMRALMICSSRAAPSEFLTALTPPEWKEN